MKQPFSTKHDSLFPKGVMLLGGAMCFFGCIAIFEKPLLGMSVALTGAITIFSDQGAEFKPGGKLFRYYIGIFGIRFGKWESYENYPDMALLTKRMTTTSYSRSNRQTNQTELVHELYLLSADHRKKILAFVFKNLATAENAKPKLLADNLGVNYTTYAPAVSAKTAARRRP